MRLYDLLPEIALDETRTITVLPTSNIGLPPGNYGLVEMYCNDEDCDCRRVLFDVMFSSTMKSVAYIGFGWEHIDFYAKWYLGKKVNLHKIPRAVLNDILDLKGPALNTMSPQSSMAPVVLDFISKYLQDDTLYVDRLKRHYNMFRDKINEMHTKSNITQSENL
jgi:hypothetical protein